MVFGTQDSWSSARPTNIFTWIIKLINILRERERERERTEKETYC